MLKLEKQHKILGVNLKNQRGPKKNDGGWQMSKVSIVQRERKGNFLVLNSRIKIAHLDTTSFTEASKQFNALFKKMK